MVDVEEHTRVGVLVESRESNTSGVSSASTRDSELNAADVGLHSVEGVSVVESQDLTSEQVVSRCNIFNTSILIFPPRIVIIK